MKRLAAALLVLFQLTLRGTAGATYLPNERIPTDSEIYRDLERLADRYGMQPRFLSTRPLRRAEALAFLDSVAEARPGADTDPAWVRARRFLDVSAKGAMRPLLSGAGDEGQRIEISPYGSSIYSDDPRNHPDINRDDRLGLVMAGSLDTSTVFVADLYEGTASQGGRGTPNFGEKNALVENVDFNSWMNEAYVEFPISKIRFLFGHTWLRWGPGETGTLAMSDAAPALDMLRAEAGMFGKLRYSQFVSLLDPGPETYLAGHRLEWQQGPRLSVGATEMARFDGTSQAALYFIPFVPYSFWEKRPKSGTLSPEDTTGELLHKNNVMWAADASWIAGSGVRIYGEFLLDDFSFSTDYKPDMIGYQAGVDWRRAIGGGRALGAIVEYDRVNNYVYSVYHHHDFEFEGFPTGYVLGPDVQALSGEISLEWGSDWEFRVRGEWRRKGEGDLGEPWLKSDGPVDANALSGIVERETRVGGEAIYSPARWLRLSAAVGASGIENRDHIPAAVESFTPLRLAARVEW